MAKTHGPAPKPTETKAQILERTEREKVKFLRLQFTDILGTIKNVEIPDRQFEDALDGKIMFDGSSIRARTCAVRSSSRSRRWASTSKRRTTRSPRGSTRSISATTTS